LGHIPWLCALRKKKYVNFEMGKMWHVHKLLMDKSHAQAIQFRWLVEMQPILGHRLAKHLHGLELGGGHHLHPMIYFVLIYVGFFQMVFYFKTPKRASLSSNFCCIESITLCLFCSSLFCTCDTLSCNSCQELSNSMLDTSIGYHLPFLS